MALAEGEVPVGAVLVAEGEVIARAHNLPISLHDPTAHAEILALREAALRKQNYRLPNSMLYVTVEPCPMCAGSMIHARVGRLIFGTADPKSGACGSVYDLLAGPGKHSGVTVVSGVLEGEQDVPALAAAVREQALCIRELIGRKLPRVDLRARAGAPGAARGRDSLPRGSGC